MKSIPSIEDFFFDDPCITPKKPWEPLPAHSLEQSPCYPIIGFHSRSRLQLYYCKLHPGFENIYLESIEHHCKFYNQRYHKSEIQKFLQKVLAEHETKMEL